MVVVPFEREWGGENERSWRLIGLAGGGDDSLGQVVPFTDLGNVEK